MNRNKYFIKYSVRGLPQNLKFYSYCDVICVGFDDDAKRIFGFIFSTIQSELEKTRGLKVTDTDIDIEVLTLLDSSVKS